MTRHRVLCAGGVRRSRVLGAGCWVGAAGVVAVALAIAPCHASAQGAPPPVQPPARRRALEIRAQAPAPEVVTVRPREIPVFTRRIIVPALVPPITEGPKRSTVVILPAPLPEAPAAATPNPPRPPA